MKINKINGCLQSFSSVSIEEKIFVAINDFEIEFFENCNRNGNLFILENEVLKLQLSYGKNKSFCCRTLILNCKTKLKVFKLRKVVKFKEKIIESFDYKTFRNAYAFTLVRLENTSVLLGFANPYCSSKIIGTNEIEISFEPSLILESNEVFDFDADFFGCCANGGEKIELRTPMTPLRDECNEFVTRYHNPTMESLYVNEVRMFQNFIKEYFAKPFPKFVHEFYMYFSPIKPQPETCEEEAEYYRYIDNFKRMNGDLIVFQPLIRQTPPSFNKKDYWTIYEENSIAQRIVQYAKNKGLKVGFYMGSAQGNEDYSNSPMIPYSSKDEKLDWKKIDKNGVMFEENCICNDDFAEWFANAQIETIKKYDLDFWDWDPGVGNGLFCYAKNHGHLPGKGAYKGFRNALKIIEKILDAKPNIYLQAFHGMKEYGVWGLRYFQQHEAYWEQDPGFFATSYNHISADVITANGMRLQAWWNENYRLLPGYINHSIANRMIQNCDEPHKYLRNTIDYLGYKFALLSAIATGASITSPIIPYDLELPKFKEYLEFYKKWTSWARKNYKYLTECIPFGSQPDLVKVDAYARIVKNKGYIFLCNGNLTNSSITFKLNQNIGFTGKSISFETVYPKRGTFIDTRNGKSIFKLGDEIFVNVPYQTIIILKLVSEKEPAYYGIKHKHIIENNSLYLNNCSGAEGSCESIYLNENSTIKHVFVNKQEIKSETFKDYKKFSWIYGGECGRYLLFNKKKNGGFNSEFFISKKAKITRDVDDEYKDEFSKESNEFNMHYSWNNKSRIYLIPVFKDASIVNNLKMSINSKQISVNYCSNWAINRNTINAYYTDATDLINYGHNNDLEISFDGDQNNLINAILYYEELSKTKVVNSIKNINYFPIDQIINSNKKYTVSNDSKIEILTAFVDKDFTKNSVVTLNVKLNCDPLKIKRIITSCPISIEGSVQLTMNTDRLLKYNSKTDMWETQFIVGKRKYLIIDEEYLNILVVTKNNETITTNVKIEWVN